MATQIYANKVDYITYLFANPEAKAKIGSKLLLPATAIMNFMLYKKCFGTSEEAKKKNCVYLASIHKFLEHLPQELVAKTARKLISTGQVIKSDRDILHISNEIAQYFYGLTENETFNTINTSETPKKAKTVNTDNSWSSLPSFKCLRKEDIKDMLGKQKLGEDDFKTPFGQKRIMRLIVSTYLDSVFKHTVETQFIEDINSIFGHFNVEKSHIKILYAEIKKEYLQYSSAQKNLSGGTNGGQNEQNQ